MPSLFVRLAPLAAAFLFAAGIPMVRFLVADFDFILLGGIRMLAAFCCLGVIWLWRAKRARISLGDLGRLALSATLMIYVNQLLIVGGLTRTTATNASLLSALNPLVGVLVAFVFLRERMSARRAFGVVLGLCGVALVLLNRPGAELAGAGVGDLMVIAGIFGFGIGGLLVQRLAARVDVITISVLMHGIGSVLLLTHAGVEAAWTGSLPRMPVSVWPWLLLLFVGAVCTGFANLLWNHSLMVLGVARAGVWLYWMPIFGIALSVTFLGEPVTRWHFISLVMVLCGTWLGTQRRPRETDVPIILR